MKLPTNPFYTQTRSPYSAYHKPRSNFLNPPVQTFTLKFSATGTLKIMTYNMRHFAIKYNNRGTASNVAKLNAIAGVIKNQKPDIIACQEVSALKDLEYLNEHYLKDYPHIYFFPSRVGSHNLAFMSKSGYELVFPQSNLNRYGHLATHLFHWRDFPSVSVQTTLNGKKRIILKLYTLHLVSSEKAKSTEKLKCILKKPYSENYRQEEASRNTRILGEDIQANPDLGIVVLGDFNASIKTPHGKQILETFTHQGQLQCYQTDHGKATHRSGEIFDYILTRNVDIIQPPTPIGTPTQKPWKHASDHLPVVTVIKPNASQETLYSLNHESKKNQKRYA